MSKHNLGAMIDYFRRLNDMTLEDMGRRLGKDQSAISKWISGTRSPKVDDLIKLTKIFDTDIETLMYGTPESETSMLYPYFNGSVAAGTPAHVDGECEKDAEKIEIPNHLMGKYSGSKGVFFLRVNGESMNNVIPHGSLIAVKMINYLELRKNDIVVFANDHEYSVKRFIDDTKNHRYIFRPDSTDEQFTDIIVSYEEAQDLKLIGKVILSIVNYE